MKFKKPKEWVLGKKESNAESQELQALDKRKTFTVLNILQSKTSCCGCWPAEQLAVPSQVTDNCK